MSDIVERLRREAEAQNNEWPGGFPMLIEAADEIERLRHDIEQLVAVSADLATENERLRAEIRTCMCPGGGWNGMPKDMEPTVENCVAHDACGCSLGAALRECRT